MIHWGTAGQKVTLWMCDTAAAAVAAPLLFSHYAHFLKLKTKSVFPGITLFTHYVIYVFAASTIFFFNKNQ